MLRAPFDIVNKRLSQYEQAMSNIETMRKLVSVTEYLEVINSQLFVSQNYEKKKKLQICMI